MSNNIEALMMQQYDFFTSLQDEGPSTNTSTKSVSISQPSQQVIRNIKAFARCIQQVKVEDATIKLYLN